ncbi:MAG: YdjY domain-containing protein [Verrucomicrobiales bacterium]|nr:YdjY domain-containing protein [Verrucomicrobiales bacterium]
MRLILGILLIASLGAAQDEKEPTPVKPSVKKIGDTTYRLGLVEFDAKTREISIPVVVNQREGGPIEYILVHENGKTHESILTTKARPMNVQIALKLLKYQAGEGDVFDKLLPAEDRKIKGDKSAERGEAVDVLVKWMDKEEEKISSINQWTIDGETIKGEGQAGEAMPEHPWNYTGSVIMDGKFLGEIEGSIIAIYLDPVSLFNTTVPGAEIDERWGANDRVIPEIGTKATLILRPLKK